MSDAEKVARLMEGAARSTSEEWASKNSKEATKRYKASFRAHDIAHEHEVRGDKKAAASARKREKRLKDSADKLDVNRRYADERERKINASDKNQLAISKYKKKQNSKTTKAKKYVRGLISKATSKGQSVTQTHKRTDDYVWKYPWSSDYTTTQYHRKKKR